MNGLKVLVTRPEPECSNLVQAIIDEGGEAYAFPCLSYEALDPSQVIEQIKLFQGHEILIFISPRATTILASLPTDLLKKIQAMAIIAMGKGTFEALKHFNCEKISCPPGESNSEAILALPALQNVCGKSIVIFRGKTGRELIYDTLKNKGASVRYLEVYHMKPTSVDIQPLLLSWQHKPFDIVIITSAELLKAFMSKIGPHQNLNHTVLTIMSETMLNLLKSYNIKNWQKIDSANQQDLLRFLQRFQYERDRQ